eukprot:jgi/Chlat1/1902/Chrsp147S02215
MDEEDEVYGGELPEDVEGELEGDEDGNAGEKDDSSELEAMKRRLKEMEEEAAKLRAMQAKVEKEMNGSQENAAASANKEEADARSIYIGNVDYNTTPEELQAHFSSCGTVNRVTILTDQFGAPKGFAYLEFLEADAVQNATLLNESEIRGRQIKVSAKRTNVPGMKLRGRGRGGYRGGYAPYAPRGRGRGFGPQRGRGRGYRYRPYY